MRVLMVTQAVDLDHPILGFTHTWINALARRVEELHVVTLVAGRRHLAGNVVLHAYGPPAASHSRLSRFWFYNKHFARLILDGRVDVIFVHMIPRWVLLAAPYAKPRQVPIVLWYAHGAASRQLRLAHHLADRVVTSSPESYPLWDEDRVVVVGQGIDTKRFCPAPRQSDGLFRVLSVGRLSPVKQYDILIEAARILVQERGMDNLRVRVVGGPARPGDEEYVRTLRRKVSAYGLEGRFAFAGTVRFDKIVSEYQRSQLFVSCQPTSMDKTVLEAMACGVPVVASSPAFEPLLSEVGSKWVVPDGDSRGVADVVEQVAGMSPEQRLALGLMMREKVEQGHGVERLMLQLVRMFEQLLENS
ncbi:MAG: glycosyltransferase family 4 protein [Anaerolineae bacterium]